MGDDTVSWRQITCFSMAWASRHHWDTMNLSWAFQMSSTIEYPVSTGLCALGMIIYPLGKV